MKVVCFGPGPKFKGGIANYNTSLAKAFDQLEGVECHIVSWTQQYPAIVPREFVDKASRTDQLAGTKIQVKYITNYNNPFSWGATVRYIKELKPDLVVFQWAIAVQGLPLGFMARRLMNAGIKVVFDLHFVIQKEQSAIDRLFTKYGIGRASEYVVHARKTADELQTLYPQRKYFVSENGGPAPAGSTKVHKLYHPIYDMFKPSQSFDVEAFKREHGLRKHVFLFFGFIRKYKGLHNAIQAFKKVTEQRDDVSLIVCGESFWQTLDNTKWSTRIKNFLFGTAKKIFLKNSDDERNYQPLDLIKELKLEEYVYVKNEFVANEDVHQYFQVSDAVLLFYLYATPSGVESVSYNFKMPILATRVGHFPETVKDGFNGYLAEPENIDSMAEKMLYFLEKPIPRENVAVTADEMSWKKYAQTILS